MSNFLRHLGSQLAEMEKLIDKMLQADLNKCITMELNRPVSETSLLAEEVSIHTTLMAFFSIGPLISYRQKLKMLKPW